MAAKYIKVIQELFQTKYPQKQDQRTVAVQNVRFKIFFPQITQLLSSYTELLSLSLTHCDIRNLQNFPRLTQLQQLDLSHNQVQGTFNNLMPLRSLKYLNIESNIVFQYSKLAPLRKIAGGHQKSLFKINICVKNNPFTTQQHGYLSKLKAFGLKLIQEPKEYFDKKKADQQKAIQQKTNQQKASRQKANLKGKQVLSSRKKKHLKKNNSRTHRKKHTNSFSSSDSSSQLSSLMIDSSQINNELLQIPPIVRMGGEGLVSRNQSAQMGRYQSAQMGRNQSIQLGRSRLQRHPSSRVLSFGSRMSSQSDQTSRLLNLRTILGDNFNNQRGDSGRLIVRLGSLGSSNRQSNRLARQISGSDSNNFDFEAIQSDIDDSDENEQMQQQRLFGLEQHDSPEYATDPFSRQVNSRPSVIRFSSAANNSIQPRNLTNPLQRGLSQISSDYSGALTTRERLEQTLNLNLMQLNRLRGHRQTRHSQRQMQRQIERQHHQILLQRHLESQMQRQNERQHHQILLQRHLERQRQDNRHNQRIVQRHFERQKRVQLEVLRSEREALGQRRTEYLQSRRDLGQLQTLRREMQRARGLGGNPSLGSPLQAEQMDLLEHSEARFHRRRTINQQTNRRRPGMASNVIPPSPAGLGQQSSYVSVYSPINPHISQASNFLGQAASQQSQPRLNSENARNQHQRLLFNHQLQEQQLQMQGFHDQIDQNDDDDELSEDDLNILMNEDDQHICGSQCQGLHDDDDQSPQQDEDNPQDQQQQMEYEISEYNQDNQQPQQQMVHFIHNPNQQQNLELFFSDRANNASSHLYQRTNHIHQIDRLQIVQNTDNIRQSSENQSQQNQNQDNSSSRS